MKESVFIALIQSAQWILSNAPTWFNNLKASGELTEAGEAAYQAHQEAIFNKPEAQPRDEV